MKKNLKNIKGITLVSLVVTIIILIILAGVSINMIIGQDGIITIAKRAKENMELARIEEQTQLNELYTQLGEDGTLGGLDYDAIAKLDEFKSAIADAITQKGVETSSNDSVETMVENIGKLGEVGTGGGEITLSSLQPGEYVLYDTGDSSIGENGVITCRVLYPVSSEYGLQIISVGIVKSNIMFPSLDLEDTWESIKPGYNNIIEILNNKTEKYKNDMYAYDARCVGSLPFAKDGMFINKDEGATETEEVWDGYTTPTGWSSRDTGCLKGDNNYQYDVKQLEEINALGTGSYYLASRIVSEDGTAMRFRCKICRIK